jgi:WD40 repeat protein
LIGLTSQRELVQFSLASAHLESNLEANWKQLGAGNHAGPIMDMSVCSRKPLVATCAQDNTLRIWNYETHQCEISKRFAEDMSSCSLHPNGLHILIGFSDKLRLMNLLIDDVRVFREFPIRGCRLCSFSNGGHLFAVVHGHVVMIYSTSTEE